MLQADGTHGLGYARSFAFNNRFRRLRCDIAWSQPYAARGKYQVEFFLIAPFTQRALDQCLFVRDDRTCANDGLWQLPCDHGPDIFTTGVFPSAFGAAVADGENSNRNHAAFLPGLA